MKLSTIITGLGLGLIAPIVMPQAADSVVMAQNYDVKAEDFSMGVQKFMNGMSTLYHSETFEDTGDLHRTSFSKGYFRSAADMFFRVTMNDPNYKSGRAMEMYLLSKVAMNQDITQDVKELIGDSEFKYKTKLKDFLVGIVNGNKLEINFLNKKNDDIARVIEVGRKYEKDFAWMRRAEILQTLYEVDEKKLEDLDKFGRKEVVDISRRYIHEKDKDAAIKILLKFTEKWQDDYMLPYRAGIEFERIKDIPNAMKYTKLAKSRAPPEEKERMQKDIDYLKKKY